MKRPLKDKKCKHCDKTFRPSYSAQQYCSKECWYEYCREKSSKICPVCKTKFHPRRVNSKTCSRSCASKLKSVRTKGRRSTKKNKHTIKTVDGLWSKIVKVLAGYKCEYCGKTSYLNSHHIYSRAKRNLRWNLDNGVCLCAGCHAMSSTFSAHKTPVEFVEWLYENKGKDFMDKLGIKSRRIEKIDMEEEYLKLKNIEKDLTVV